MTRKYEVVAKLRKADAGAVKASGTERVLFTVTKLRREAQALADAYAFLVGQTVTDIFVRAVKPVRDKK
jgi:hypothetical protein